VSPEAEGVAAEPSEEWYAQAERAFQALKNRLERAEREVSRREHDLEMRERDLADGERRLEERLRSLDAASREVVANAGSVALETRVLAADRQALERDRVTLEASRKELDEARSLLDAKEASLRTIEKELAERSMAVAQSQKDLEMLQSGHEVAYAAARDEIVKAHETLWEQARASGAELPPRAPSPTSLEEALQHVLALRDVMETAASAAHDREERAKALLAEATVRAQEIQTFEGRVRDEEARLASLKAEVVGAKRALLIVDAALARMPYDVVDDFTRSDEFDAYEKAVKELRRIPDG
jgi:chromosome segregation ATPase